MHLKHIMKIPLNMWFQQGPQTTTSASNWSDFQDYHWCWEMAWERTCSLQVWRWHIRSWVSLFQSVMGLCTMNSSPRMRLQHPEASEEEHVVQRPGLCVSAAQSALKIFFLTTAAPSLPLACPCSQIFSHSNPILFPKMNLGLKGFNTEHIILATGQRL